MGGPLFSSAEITSRRSQTGVHERQNILEGGGRIAGTMKERLWPELCRGRPIIERWVARQLHSFKIVSSNIRIGAEHKVGFTLACKLSISKRQVKNQNDNGKTGFLQHLGTGELARAGHNSIRKSKPYYEWRV